MLKTYITQLYRVINTKYYESDLLNSCGITWNFQQNQWWWLNMKLCILKNGTFLHIEANLAATSTASWNAPGVTCAICYLYRAILLLP